MTATLPAQRPARPHEALTADAIRAARGRIPAEFRDTPQYVQEQLSAIAGSPVVVKVETVNPVRAFKGRGTWLAVHALAAAGRISEEQPVVVASTGNFGQGVAYAARAAGASAVIFADVHAVPTKLDRIRAFGGLVIESGEDFDAAREASEAYARDHGLELLVDGDDPLVGTGAGTIALELTDAAERGELPPIANAYIPVGNGALIVGVGAWLRQVAPGCRVVGVQSEAAPSMTWSWREGRPIATERAATIADGIATRVPVPAALELMDGRVDEMLLVREADLPRAQAVLANALGVTVEAAAGASWAGVLADTDRRPGACLVLVTGSNVVTTTP
ncbi:MAG TPA: pyridoxal-phosphate dependent enzyme [Candidatus Limnocylindrales bacterium]|nr:pyridoxal-phosphate dependent enzyme [Candidatus Limnocylindrales bacterium]